MKKKLVLIITFILSITFAFSQSYTIPTDLNQQIPVDKKIKTGTLSNGIKYYVRENAYPKNRAELRLVLNAGSLQEDDDQLGLAHFCEHMAFNGTKNFKKHELINFLESIGMKFGAELNAYTSFDETVYMLTIPLDKHEYIDTGFQILSDWAHNVSFEDEEIAKERGVIKEEWRLGQGAQDRMSRKFFPVLFYNSQYAKRMVIGKPEIFETASFDTYRRFYQDWYRPDLMAVVAVGDFNSDQVIALIEKYFSPIKPKNNPRERVKYPVPDHDKTFVSIVADKEFPYNLIQIFIKREPETQGSYNSYRNNIISSLYTGMLNNRINEIAQGENPPFLYGAVADAPLIRTKNSYMLIGMAKNNQALTTMNVLLTENERVKRFGFTSTELERQKLEMMKSIEKIYKERDQQKSANIAGEYQRNYLDAEPIPGIEAEYEMYKAFLPTITLDEVNKLASKLYVDKNMVVVMMFPEKKEIKLPKEKEVLNAIKSVQADKTIAAYVDKVVTKPLISVMPVPAKVMSTKDVSQFGAIEWTLANGARVVIKKTDFKNDEILMQAYSYGGQSVYPDKDDVSAGFAAEVIDMSGLGEFENTDLQKLLTGKVVNVTPMINLYSEGFSGSSTPADFETMLQLIYMYFTSPRKDVKAYNNFITAQLDVMKNKGADPEEVFNDTMTAVTNNYHPRFMPMKIDDLSKANHDRMMEIFKDRFKDASDFVFFFVGNVDIDKAKPMIEQYIGGIPSLNTKESFVDLKVKEPAGIVKKTVNKGKEPKATVYLNFPGVYDYSLDNRIKLDMMKDVLNITLREIIREDQSGTYGISAWISHKRYPNPSYNFNIYFGCAPENTEKLINLVFQELEHIKNTGTTEVNINKVKETLLRSRETNLRENRFWISSLNNYYFNNINFDDFARYESIVNSFTNKDLMEFAKKYIDETHYIQLLLMPEK